VDLNITVCDLRDIPDQHTYLHQSEKIFEKFLGRCVSGVFRWRTGIRELSVNLT
jgi:hypothetical protein